LWKGQEKALGKIVSHLNQVILLSTVPIQVKWQEHESRMGSKTTVAAYFSTSYLLDLPKSKYQDVRLCTVHFIPYRSQQSDQYKGSF